MLLHDNIRFFRQAKSCTQEDISPQAHSRIKRGETDVDLSKVMQLAELFEIKLSELVGFDVKNIFNFGHYISGTQTQHNHQRHCMVGNGVSDYVELKIEFEKQQILLKQQGKKIELLNEIIALMKAS